MSQSTEKDLLHPTAGFVQSLKLISIALTLPVKNRSEQINRNSFPFKNKLNPNPHKEKRKEEPNIGQPS